MLTGRSDCDSTRCATFLVVAPSAIRTPISFARCSTRYRQDAEQARQRQHERQSSKDRRDPKGDPHDVCLRSGDRAHGGDLAQTGIDAREVFEQSLTRLLRVATHAQGQRGSRALGAGWQVYAPEREQVGMRGVHLTSLTTPTTVNVRGGSESRVRRARCRSVEAHHLPRRCDSARAGALRSRRRL